MEYFDIKHRKESHSKKILMLILVVIISCPNIFSQNNKLYTVLGTFNSINSNTVEVMGCGTERNLDYVYFTSPWLCKREIKIPYTHLNEAKNSINLVSVKFKEWNNLIQGKGFKGKRKKFPTEHTVYTRQSYLYDWHPKAEKLYYVFFVDLSGRAVVEVKMTLGGSNTFCFYLTPEGLEQYSSIINNAVSIYLKSDDVEFDELLK